jgi:hypothetical protein
MRDFSGRVRLMLRDILIFAAGAVMTALGVTISASSEFWHWVIGIGITAMLVSAVHLFFEHFIRPRLVRKVDPLLVTALSGALITFGALTVYAIKGPQAPLGAANADAHGTPSATPDLALIPPDSHHEIRWNPRASYMILAAPEGEIKDNRGTTPIFIVKTVNNTPVQDATIRWQTEISGILKLVKESKNLSDYKIDATGGNLTISGGPTPLIPFTYRDSDIASSQDISVPFITNAGANAFIPSNIFSSAMLYTLALMPDTPGARLNPFTFSVTVSWNLPTPGSQKFLVKATIVNAKPPNIDEPKLDAFMSFEVAKVQ